MCVKQYFENLSTTKTRVNILAPKAFIPAPLPDIFTITRQVNSIGGINPAASNLSPLPVSPTINLAGTTAGVITYPAQGLVTFTNAPFNPLQNLFPGSLINGLRFGQVNQTPGSNLPPLPQNGVAGVVRYFNGAINVNLTVTVVCVPSTIGATFDLMFSSAPPLPLNFVRLVDVTFGYNFPPATNEYIYSVTPTVAPTSIALPITVRTERSDSPGTTIIENWSYTNPAFGAQQILSLTDLNDPIANGWATPVTFLAAYDPTKPNIPGWTFRLDNPFCIVGLGRMGTIPGGGLQYANALPVLDPKADQNTYKDLLFNFAFGIFSSEVYDPHLGYLPATNDKTTYIAGDYPGQFYNEFGAAENYEINLPAMSYAMALVRKFWEEESPKPNDETEKNFLNMLTLLLNSTEPRFWLAPGTYFYPDQDLIGAQTPSWTQFNAYITAKAAVPSFAALEIVSIG